MKLPVTPVECPKASSPGSTTTSTPVVPLEKRSDFGRVCRVAMALAFVSGIVNVVALLEVGYLVSHMTGGTSKLGLTALSSGGTQFLGLVGILSAYSAGAASIALAACDGEAPFQGRQSLGLLASATAVSLGAVLQHVTGYVPLALGLWAFSQGLQNGVTTRCSSMPLRTTHMTGNVTDIGLGMGRWLRAWMKGTLTEADNGARRKSMFFLLLVVAFAFGGFCAFMLEPAFGPLAALFPATILAFMAVVLPWARSLLSEAFWEEEIIRQNSDRKIKLQQRTQSLRDAHKDGSMSTCFPSAHDVSQTTAECEDSELSSTTADSTTETLATSEESASSRQVSPSDADECPV